MNKVNQRVLRHRRVRRKITGTVSVPRLAIFRSNKHIYAQIIDDTSAKTIISSSDQKITTAKTEKRSKVEAAKQVGLTLALAAKSKNIAKVVFDRGGFKYHGRIKAVADGAREGGLNF